MLCKLEWFKNQMNHHFHGPMLSCTQPLRLECDILEGFMNLEDGMNLAPNKFMQNQMFIQEFMHEIAKTPWRRVTTLSRSSSKEALPSAHLYSYGFKMIFGERYSLGGLQGVEFQHPMKCKKKNLIWEDGNLLWRSTKVEIGRRHPSVVKWMWMEIKKL